MTEALTTRVRFRDRRAVGVEYRRHGTQRRVDARREVILCGGTVNSPQLLMLSGIAPAAVLARHGIEPVHPLPGVGQNLQDHLDVLVSQRDRRRSSLSLGPLAWPSLAREAYRYWRRRQGVFSTNCVEAGGFLKSHPELDRPDLQLHFLPAIMHDHGRRADLGYGYSIHVCHLRPQSRGYITLASADPTGPPIIQPNYLSHPDDMQPLVDGVKLVKRILAMPPFDRYRGTALAPTANANDDETLRAFIRERAETNYHPVGSCKMGTDAMAVVDPQLRVHGVQGLRVADASIMPTLIGGNTNATAITIGEKCGELIRAERRSE